MEYKRPVADDFEQMVALQNKNLVSVLNPADKSDGFLSASFTSEQFKIMDNDLCVVICTDKNKVCGYICATSVEFNKQIPIVATMLEQLPFIIYQNKPLSAYNHAIPGPVCIDKDYRGQGILFNLYTEMKFYLLKEHKELELFTVLIASENQRSVNAHKKLGMEVVGQYTFNGTIFWILVLPIKKVPSIK